MTRHTKGSAARSGDPILVRVSRVLEYAELDAAAHRLAWRVVKAISATAQDVLRAVGQGVSMRRFWQACGLAGQHRLGAFGSTVMHNIDDIYAERRRTSVAIYGAPKGAMNPTRHGTGHGTWGVGTLPKRLGNARVRCDLSRFQP